MFIKGREDGGRQGKKWTLPEKGLERALAGCACACLDVSVCLYVHLNLCVFLCVSLCIWECMCMSVSVRLCVFVWVCL